MAALLEVALVATFQPCWTIEDTKQAHCLGTSSVAEKGVGGGA